MAIINEEEKVRIRKAVEEAELSTSGEFVTVIAARSDEYRYIPLLWASMIALALPALCLPLWSYFLPNLFVAPEMLYIIQVACFLVAAFAFQVEALKMKLIPGGVKKERAARLANMVFLKEGLHRTKDRAGVLLFVSFAERYVEIIADSGINEKVDQDYWAGVVESFLGRVKNGEITEGFIRAIEGCREPLALHFPVQEDDANELPDRLIEI